MRAVKQLLWWLIAGSEGGLNRGRIIDSLQERPCNANQLADKLAAALGDKKKAVRIAKKARVLLQKETETRKKILAIDLSVSEEVVTSLFSAGCDSVESIGAASLDELERILGDKKLAVEVSTSAQELM